MTRSRLLRLACTSAAKLRDEINTVNGLVDERVNNGVYRTGFATTQMAYEAAFDRLFETLDALDLDAPHGRAAIGSNGEVGPVE